MNRRFFDGSVRGMLIASVLCLWLPFVFGSVAEANGGPIRIVLSYVDGLSNWGPKDASGVLELVKAEGEVRMTATGLPALAEGEYVLWILAQETGESLKLASFGVNASGIAHVDLLLPQPIPDRNWNLALVTVESSPQASAPGQQHSLAGYFPKPPANTSIPGQLPNTGAGMVWRLPAAIATVVVLLFVMFVTARLANLGRR